MNKRDKVLHLLEDDIEQDYVPAGFFIHFDKTCHHGQAAIDKHLEFYQHTGMDFVKIQYETPFPPRLEIKSPDDWGKMPLYGKDFYEDQLYIVEGLVKKAKKDALVIMTTYSPFMCAGQTTRHTPDMGQTLITEHIKENPEKVKQGMEVITESLMLFVKACIELGVDGFYASTQGGESHRFEDIELFNACVKPYDLALMEEMNRCCQFNILHVCDFHDGYDSLAPFVDYPGDVVNCSLTLGDQEISAKEVSRMFGRLYMGGLDRKGVIATGTEGEIDAAVAEVLQEAPDRFILGADCTLPADIDWDNIRTAISAAHNPL
ncbi:MAG: uroporphyrinogen decarboxylase family protein [Candidatus Latescibacteria bacterium]|jgi:uroporphyrinogen decarboxylase|nr:uroporphyrinogen decarboxylase family protein [Candidatus Latescibacterota bacterium]